jgi:hypothetical protein
METSQIRFLRKEGANYKPCRPRNANSIYVYGQGTTDGTFVSGIPNHIIPNIIEEVIEKGYLNLDEYINELNYTNIECTFDTEDFYAQKIAEFPKIKFINP